MLYGRYRIEECIYIIITPRLTHHRCFNPTLRNLNSADPTTSRPLPQLPLLPSPHLRLPHNSGSQTDSWSISALIAIAVLLRSRGRDTNTCKVTLSRSKDSLDFMSLSTTRVLFTGLEPPLICI